MPGVHGALCGLAVDRLLPKIKAKRSPVVGNGFDEFDDKQIVCVALRARFKLGCIVNTLGGNKARKVSTRHPGYKAESPYARKIGGQVA